MGIDFQALPTPEGQRELARLREQLITRHHDEEVADERAREFEVDEVEAVVDGQLWAAAVTDGDRSVHDEELDVIEGEAIVASAAEQVDEEHEQARQRSQRSLVAELDAAAAAVRRGGASKDFQR